MSAKLQTKKHKVVGKKRVPISKYYNEGNPVTDGTITNPVGEIDGFSSHTFLYKTDPSLEISNQGGAVVGVAGLRLLFWGNFWQTAVNPSATDIMAAVNAIVASPYLDELKQYGFQEIDSVSSMYVPESFSSETYSDGDVEGMVDQLITDGKFPEPDEPGGRNIYMVFAPKGVRWDGGTPGAHSETNSGSWFDVDTVWVGWVDYGNLNDTSNVLDSITTVFSHELVEIISDPEPNQGDQAWIFPSVEDKQENEIGDVCSFNYKLGTGGYGFVWAGGNTYYRVASYYSAKLKSCCIPTRLPPRSLHVEVQGPAPNGSLTNGISGTWTAPVGDRCYKGNYSWTSDDQAQRLVLVASTKYYSDPVFHWKVNDFFLFLNKTNNIQTRVSRDDEIVSMLGVDPPLATLRITPAGNTLTIDLESGDGLVYLDISCSCSEKSLPDNYGTFNYFHTSKSMVARALHMDKRFLRDEGACFLGRVAGISFRIGEFVLKYIEKGDPVPPWAQKELHELSRGLAGLERIVDRLPTSSKKGRNREANSGNLS